MILLFDIFSYQICHSFVGLCYEFCCTCFIELKIGKRSKIRMHCQLYIKQNEQRPSNRAVSSILLTNTGNERCSALSMIDAGWGILTAYFASVLARF